MQLTKQIRVVDKNHKGVPNVRVETSRGIQATDNSGFVTINVIDPAQNVNIRVKNFDKNFMFVELPQLVYYDAPKPVEETNNNSNQNGKGISILSQNAGFSSLLVFSILGFAGYKLYQKYK